MSKFQQLVDAVEKDGPLEVSVLAMRPQKFYHIIGHSSGPGIIHYNLGYKIERALYHFRQLIALIICPELRVHIERERFNMEYIIQVRKEWKADVKARDKGIARLQRERKQFRQRIKELGG